MKKTQIETLKAAVQGYCDDCIGEDTPENRAERRRIEAAWAAFVREQNKTSK